MWNVRATIRQFVSVKPNDRFRAWRLRELLLKNVADSALISGNQSPDSFLMFALVDQLANPRDEAFQPVSNCSWLILWFAGEQTNSLQRMMSHRLRRHHVTCSSVF